MLEPLARPGRNDEGGGKRDFRSAIPAAKTEEGVRAHQSEQLSRRKLGLQSIQGVDGVVRLTRWIRSVSERDRKVGQAANGELRHRDPVFKACARSHWLERLGADRREQNCVEPENCLGGSRDAEMSHMRRVEAAAEKRDPLCAACGNIHLFMVSRGQT